MIVLGSGCQSGSSFLSKFDIRDVFSKPPEAPPPPVDNMVMRGGGLEKDQMPASGTSHAELEGAKTLYAQGKYAEAERIFHRLAHNSKNTPQLAEEALFFEADSLYMQGRYPRAEATFKNLLKEFRLHGRFHDQANRRLFDIAQYWLDDTQKIMRAYEEEKNGKNWLVVPAVLQDAANFVHFEKSKPLFDPEGRAVEALEEVRLNDISGPLGEKALFYIATIKFFRAEYKDADYYYSQVFENFPNGKLAPKAIKYSIICKQLLTGGSAYDTRVLAEARKLIHRAGSYSELVNDDSKFLDKQLLSISYQQADKDYLIAEFYRRTGHPGSAYFYYELVRRRYPGTSYSEKAIKRMEELHGRLEKEAGQGQGRNPGPANPSPAPADGAILGPEPRILPPGLVPGNRNGGTGP